ncbi:hypothetical protein OG239_04085 [Streptomyces sp. NBC_00868]|uniref:hypothetical protein n=1 Tax=unclassified Streptomyces TaxID=2593676 RepID=UPI0032464ECA|nr:hypothetical protein OG239_04085 [Streptomyces sp. NBC_00868]
MAQEIAAVLEGELVVHDADGTELARVSAEPLARPAQRRGRLASRRPGRPETFSRAMS